MRVVQITPCTCTVIRHPLPKEREGLEFQRQKAQQAARLFKGTVRGSDAATEAAVLYAVLYSECVTAKWLNRPIERILRLAERDREERRKRFRKQAS